MCDTNDYKLAGEYLFHEQGFKEFRSAKDQYTPMYTKSVDGKVMTVQFKWYYDNLIFTCRIPEGMILEDRLINAIKYRTMELKYAKRKAEESEEV